MPNESTTRIKMDISELKRSMTEARRQIRLANAEFKASSAGMDNWAKSADGLSAKMNQLRATLSAEKSILNDLNKQYALTVQSQGKNSKGAQELLIKIKNQEAAINKTKASLEKYGRMMNELDKESNQTANATEEVKSAFEQLSDTISKQESDLQSLKSKYSNVILEQGKSSTEAQKLAHEITQLSSELTQNKSKMTSVSNAADELEKNLSDVGDELDDVGNEAEDSADGFTVMKGALANLVADGIKGVVGSLKEFVSDSSQAYNKFQAETGASAEEMQGFKEEMNDLYSNVYGESLQDVGDKMAYIKQVTGETDPSKIKELAENAMALEDTFGSDFNETLRGAQNMMEHFGISGTEAFDLIAKGSQEGLDYTDELGDNIAEYGGNFEQAGYSAQEYFQLLANGTQGGAYNLDKVNDSINEIKNRIGDGSIGKTMAQYDKKTHKLVEGTGIWSQKTEEAYKAWESGSGTMKDIIESIVKDINNCTNEQEALTLAQTAFGTMGEDANLKVVKSLTSVGNTFDDVKGSMEDIKNVRYDDIDTQFEQIRRSIQMDLIQPIAQSALPTIKSFVQFVIGNLNTIIPIASGVGAALGTAFTVSKIFSFIQTLQKTAVMFGLVSTATNVATGSTLAFNAAMLANPVNFAVAGIIALTAGLTGYAVKMALSKNATDENTQATNELISKQKELNKTLSDSNTERKNNISSAQEEGAQAEIYYDRLNKLIGVEKKSSAQKAVIKDYVEKLNAIMPNLNLKYDEEADKLNQSTEAIKANISAQKELMLAKAAQSNLQAVAADIVKVETQQSELTKQNVKNEEAYRVAQEKTIKARQAYLDSGANRYSEEYHAYVKAMNQEAEKREAYDKTSAAVEKNKQKLKELNGEYDKTEQYAQSKIDAAETEKALGAITEKMKAKGKEIPKAISDGIKSGQYQVPTTIAGMQNLIKFDQLATQAKVDGVKIPKSLAEGISSGKVTAQDAVNRLKEATKFDNSQTVTDAKNAGIKIPKSLREGILSGTMSTQEAGKQLSEAVMKGQVDGSKASKGNGQKAGKDFASGVNSQSANSKKSGTTVGKSTTTGMKNGGKTAKSTGQTTGKNYASGVSSQSGKAKSSGQKIGKSADSGAKTGGKAAKSTGQKLGTDYASGVGSKTGTARSKGKSLGDSAKSGAASVDAHSSGTHFAQGFINGISSLAGSAWSAAKRLAQRAWDGLKKGQKEGSPSKLTRRSGVYFGEGYNNGIKSMTKSVVSSAATMALDAYNSLRDAQQEHSPSKLTYKSGKNFTKGFINGIVSEEKNLTKIVKGMVTSVVDIMKNINNFNFSEVASNASTIFSDTMSKQITYMTDKMQYQSDQKMATLEKQLSGYQSKLDDYQSKYNSATSSKSKASKSSKTAQKNLAKAEKALEKAKTDKAKKSAKKRIATYKKQLAADKKTNSKEAKNAAAAKKQIEKYKKLVKEQTKFNEAYQNASAQMISEFNTAMSEYQTKAQALIDNTINGITDTYQAKYDDLISKQDTLISKLKNAGDLFEISNAGIMTVNDIKEQTKNIRDYTDKLQTIKEKVSSDLFDQIASYDIDEGNAFMDRLLALSDADLKAYSDAYDEKMKLSEETAKKIYSKDFEKVEKEYKDSLQEAFKDLPKELEEMGMQVMAGFTKGLTKNTDYMTSAVKTMVKAMVDQFKTQLGIHSPSKVTEKLGMFTGQGFGNGVLNTIKSVRDNVKSFIGDVTSPLTDMTASIGGMRGVVGTSSGGINTTNQTIVNNYNLVQNNTSPKSLSALDTYRARRQQVSMVKAMTHPV